MWRKLEIVFGAYGVFELGVLRFPLREVRRKKLVF